MVEFAVLAPLLLVLAGGGTDYARVMGTAAAVSGAAREAARQAAYWDPASQTNPVYGSDILILQAAKQELGSPGTGDQLSLAGSPDQCVFSPSMAPAPGYYPTADNTGYLYVCRQSATGASPPADGRNHVQVVILWRVGLLTPLVQNITGTPHLNAIVDATEQGP
jgi:hypothetical protein